ncbi:hypothetical protein BX266_0076 [Streptomyces sp. TLI_171]|nr:hypothetical protein BX266_0076 [Streptomyces sp. TLI_171]
MVAVVGGALMLGAYYLFFADSDPANAKVGDCVHNSGTSYSPSVSIVSCSAGNAEFKVLKVVNSSSDGSCDDVEGTVSSYHKSTRHSGYVLCLGRNTH